MYPYTLFTLYWRYYDIVRDVRQNKGSILKASVEYIKKLKSDQHKKRLLEEKVRIQDSQNRKLLLKLQVIYFAIHATTTGPLAGQASKHFSLQGHAKA